MRHNPPTFNQCLTHIRRGGKVEIENGDSELGWEVYRNEAAFLNNFPDDSSYEDELGEGWKKIKLTKS